jgi:hypothetical protein
MKKLFLLFLFINIYLAAYNQVIKGTVYDKKTKTIIYSAAVYINGTFVGTLTDQNGSFKLDISKYPLMPLTISAIGYFSVTLNDISAVKPLLIYMDPKLFELDEVVVNAKSNNWERREDLTVFRNEFLGTTGNALSCKILNENEIKFKRSAGNDTLKAFAAKPIFIENKALGYKITYYLDKFEYYRRSTSFFFKGNIIFQKDSTTEESKQQFFERKRKFSYLGSRMHFFRMLWINDLNSAGFTVKNSANETIGYDKIVYQTGSHEKYLKYVRGMGICYYTKQPTSFIVFIRDNVYFDANGYFDPSCISWEGEMARQRIADLLPFEYSVK